MKLVELTEFLVKSVVSDPDMVSVKQFEDDEDYIIIQVLVDDSVIGSVMVKKELLLMLLERLCKLQLMLTD